ncbi:MAG: DsrE family protein [Flavobacteriaceae bacterium]|nr:DsrE family protein [Flavobacteriaceae bacterium]
MKSLILSIACLMVWSVGISQDNPVKILFDVTSSHLEPQQATVRHVKAMSEAYPDSEFEIVVYGGALDMLLKEKSSVTDVIIDLSNRANVTVNACAGTMKRRKVDKSQLIDGVNVVPDAIFELAIKQKEGWSYVKESYNN